MIDKKRAIFDLVKNISLQQAKKQWRWQKLSL
jgi:hypothetical protein